MSESGEEPTEADTNMTTSAPQVSYVEYGVNTSQASKNPVQLSTLVKTNVFTGTLNGTLEFITDQIKIFIEDGYDTQESVVYWKFTDIKKWF